MFLLERWRIRWLAVMLVMLGCGLTVPCASAALGDVQPVQFIAGGHVLAFAPNAVHVVGVDHMLKMEFGSAHNIAPASEQRSSSNTEARPLREVTYPNLWDGISVTYDQPPNGIVKSTYYLAPGAT